LSNLVVVNSYAVRNFLVDQDGFDPRRIRVIHNGVDLERFSNGDRKDVTLKRSRSVIMVANMNVESKGHADLIDAARIVCHKLPETQFLLVGDGALRPILEERARNCGVAGNVNFLGHRDDVPHLLRDCDLAVLSSWSEGLPNAVLEAMAMSLPVVAARAGGTVELIRHKVTGILVPPREPTELANAILKLLEDRGLAEDLGRKGRDHAEAHFSYYNLLSKLDSLYQEGTSRLN
jgi:glycosyltransferase involved in cell wall biosynthesis